MHVRLLFLSLFLFGCSFSLEAFVECPQKSDAPKTFALCSLAQCWTLDNVSYCKCDLMHQESISIPFNYKEGSLMKNVCDLLLEGPSNGFTVSTYATTRPALKDYDPAVEKLGPPKALYTCDKPGYSLKPAYSAQCDGGLCFKSTEDTEFPGLGRVEKGQIICSCPPTANKSNFQIAGPWSCAPGASNRKGECCDRGYYNQFCGVRSIKTTGTRIAVGSPAGSAAILSKQLDGQFPSYNRCQFN